MAFCTIIVNLGTSPHRILRCLTRVTGLIDELVEKYGYSDIAPAFRERGGLPDPGTGLSDRRGREYRRFLGLQDHPQGSWVDLYAKPYYFACERTTG